MTQSNFPMTFMQKKIYFANSVSIVLTFLGLTIKDHIKSKTHFTKKFSQMKEKTIATLLKCKEVRNNFVLAFLKMCTLSDVLLHKIDKMKPFLLKKTVRKAVVFRVSLVLGNFICQNCLLFILLP